MEEKELNKKAVELEKWFKEQDLDYGEMVLICRYHIDKMLTKEIARELLPLVNDPISFDILKLYAEHRVAQLHKELETSNPIETPKLQGKLAEIKRIFGLQDEARKDSK